jgi:D-proline reductase (dithiol) PrdB
MPFNYLDFMTELQGGNYARRQPEFDPPEQAPLRSAIAAATIGVFVSCGARLPSQPPLGATNDLTHRLLPRSVPANDLVIDHETPIRVWAQEDVNVAYPRDRLVELEAEGVFARLADEAVSMVGSISRYTELVGDVVPRIKDEFTRQRVDLVLMFPF